MGGEVYALLLYASQLSEREHLKTAAVRENGLVPVHELMQPPHFLHDLVSRAEVEVVGVAELHLSFELAQVYGRDTALYCSGSTDVHKARCLKAPVNCLDGTAASLIVFFKKCKHICFLSVYVLIIG